MRGICIHAGILRVLRRQNLEGTTKQKFQVGSCVKRRTNETNKQKKKPTTKSKESDKGYPTIEWGACCQIPRDLGTAWENFILEFGSLENPCFAKD